MAQFNTAPSPEESGARRYYQIEGDVLRYLEDREGKDAFGSPLILRSVLGQENVLPNMDLSAMMPLPSNPLDPNVVGPPPVVVVPVVSYDWRPPDVCP